MSEKGKFLMVVPLGRFLGDKLSLGHAFLDHLDMARGRGNKVLQAGRTVMVQKNLLWLRR